VLPELNVGSPISTGSTMRKQHVLARLLIMQEGWFIEHYWSVNTSESISLPRIASDSACFLVVSQSATSSTICAIYSTKPPYIIDVRITSA
jgi:hypothetical protein